MLGWGLYGAVKEIFPDGRKPTPVPVFVSSAGPATPTSRCSSPACRGAVHVLSLVFAPSPKPPDGGGRIVVTYHYLLTLDAWFPHRETDGIRCGGDLPLGAVVRSSMRSA